MNDAAPRWSELTTRLVDLAIQEDLGHAGDITGALLGPQAPRVRAALRARCEGVACGLALLELLRQRFAAVGRVEFEIAPADPPITDGQSIAAGQTLALLSGRAADLLAAERTVLNFITRMAGVATLTSRYVAAARAANPQVQVLDTRKTIPGWRELDKYAVRCGGGQNHRRGLFDAILIKDNHLAGVPAGRLGGRLCELLSRRAAGADFVEVEVDDLGQLEEVCRVVGVDIVLLDNFSLDELRRAVALRDRLNLRGKLALEASGNVDLTTIAAVAATGVDRISVGALTHSAPALDVGLDFLPGAAA